MKKFLNFNTARIPLLILLAIALTAMNTEAASVTRTWNGSTDGNWGTAANWTPSGSPAIASPFDSVIFSGTVGLATTNNLSTSISNLTFAAGGFTVSGNSLIIRTGITNSAGVNIVNIPVTLANNPKNWDVAAGSEIDFNGGSGTTTFAGNPPFEKFDAGNVRLRGTNLWSQGADIAGGALIVDTGSLTITNDGFRLVAANGAWAGLIVTNGGTLNLGTFGGSGKNFNLKLGNTANLSGTNELDIYSGQISLGQNITQIIVGTAIGTYGIVNQYGGAIIYTNAIGRYYFNGGTLITPRIIGGSGTGYFYFNGGTLTPSSTLSASNFVSGFTTAYVNNGGAIVDTTNIDVVISQPLLANGSGGLTKLGSAALTLSGTNSYSGATRVSDGTLVVNGALGGGLVIVSSATLAGTGVIGGVVTINNNGTLALGSTDPVNTGTLTINNNLNLAGGVFAKLNKSLTQSNDTAVVSGSITATGAGTLTLSNGGPALVVGDRFQLFSQPVANGGNLSISSPPSAGLYWQNNLAVDGSVTVVNTAPITNPTIFTSVAGGRLSLSWPAGQTGWQLQAQTNGLGTNWINVAGTTLTNLFTLPIDPATGSVFFRLVSP